MLNGVLWILGTGAVKVKIYNDAGSHRFKIWVDGTLQINVTDGTFLWGGVAFGGDDALFDNCKIGYDQSGDDDIDDPTDDVVWSEGFSGTTKTPAYDHAGNMIDDGTFVYVYDAWNRLLKVRAKEDADVVIQTAEFDALGRRIKSAVTNAGNYDQTVLYYYDGHRIVETRLAGAPTVAYQQFIHGTQYIDEVVIMRVKEKGDLYVHQDANWNVIGTTDLGRHVVERDIYTPYGELTVHQDTGFGDRDGDQDVDATDKGTVGTTCTGTVTGSCRILDLDFDGDYDSTDAGFFDSLTQGSMRHPGRASTAVSQPFAHQGLLFEPELAQYQDRARQYDPGKRRFAQPDPFAFRHGTFGSQDQYLSGMSLFEYTGSNPVGILDPTGLIGRAETVGGLCGCWRISLGCSSTITWTNGWCLGVNLAARINAVMGCPHRTSGCTRCSNGEVCISSGTIRHVATWTTPVLVDGFGLCVFNYTVTLTLNTTASVGSCRQIW